jgi:hypothetical protein
MVDDQTDVMPVATQFDEESPRHNRTPLTAVIAAIRSYKPPLAVNVALITVIAAIAVLAFAMSYSSKFAQHESVRGSEGGTAQGTDPPQAQDSGLPSEVQPSGPASLAEGTDAANQSSDAFSPTASQPVNQESGAAAGLPPLPPMPSPDELAAALPPVTWPALNWPALNWPAINVPAITVPPINVSPGTGLGAGLTRLQDLMLPNLTPQLPNLTPQLPNLTPQLPNLTPQLPDLTSQLPDLTSQLPDLTSQLPDLNLTPQLPDLNLTPQLPDLTPRLPSPPSLRLPGF